MEIIPFVFEAQLGAAFGVRVVMRDGAAWFVAADVCRVLSIKNVTHAVARLDDDENTLVNSEGIHAGAGNPEVNLVSESGLYALIFQSRKPIARSFRKWVTGTVLPSIRGTGGYPSRVQQTSPARFALSEEGQAYLDDHTARVLQLVRSRWGVDPVSGAAPGVADIAERAGLSVENAARRLMLLVHCGVLRIGPAYWEAQQFALGPPPDERSSLWPDGRIFHSTPPSK